MPTRRQLLAALPLLALAGCGFRLRGSQSSRLPYASLHIALPETDDVHVWLRRHIEAAGGTVLTENPQEAEAVFHEISEQRLKSVLSVNAQGRVREYRLHLNYTFRLATPQGRTLLPPSEINLTRDITYNDSVVLAKDIEENLLWRDMSNDLVNQIMRRLSIAKPQTAAQEDD